MNTSAMVTSICGSSSRGVTSVAKMPISNATSASSGVICELAKRRAIRPETPITLLARLVGGFQRDRGLHRIEDDALASPQTRQHFDFAVPTGSPRRNCRKESDPCHSAHTPRPPRRAARRQSAARSSCSRDQDKWTRACMPGTISAKPGGKPTRTGETCVAASAVGSTVTLVASTTCRVPEIRPAPVDRVHLRQAVLRDAGGDAQTIRIVDHEQGFTRGCHLPHFGQPLGNDAGDRRTHRRVPDAYRRLPMRCLCRVEIGFRLVDRRLTDEPLLMQAQRSLIVGFRVDV
jgi:hypothetical protein